ncbi:ribonucleoside-triphosphate reductase, adenosylcobalamin-dependent [Phytophthora nicotianae]|uniref:ribonucleoside-triphosphate reductase (thioredoxin) n=1 Tax=Phytophthora nicotianae TaxID=4792 RepID=W2KPM4_PHYNI|nr:ribonucleoside-triphosphate reductase, adenosylcobalamin-dependent [Phytophthora nicotianae]
MAPTTSYSTSATMGRVVGTSNAAEAKSNLEFETSVINTNFEPRTGPDYKTFMLDKAFVASFENQTPPFGFNGLGELVYMRTYSRVKLDGTKERWFETIERVINGTFNMQKKWLLQLGRPWDEEEMNRIAQEMYTRIYQMKFTPPGRGLWAMGSPITEDRGLYAALNNCAFVSTADILEIATPSKPFCFLMEAAMLGVGVGFDTKGAGKLLVQGCDETKTNTYVIPDSREGWVESVKLLLEAHFLHQPALKFDYTLIRPAGAPIKGFGGISSGAGSLTALHVAIESILKPLAGKLLTAHGIVDIMNQMGVCVVSGNVRRTAEIAFGDYNDEEYVDLKNYKKNPDRAAFGWTSNNSIFADIGMDYKPIAERIVRNGEPGFAWLENMRNFGRMNGIKDDRDCNACGGNPCLEQTLESYEMCCLVETFPYNHDSLEDFLETLKYAYMYAKTVTLGQTQWPRTNEVMKRNRRIGCSMSGIAQFISNRGLNEFQRWCEAGYDRIQEVDKQISTRFAIPRSIKTTSIKPSGTVSLLAGATPGMHYPESRFYIRRMRLDKHSNLLPTLQRAGYEIEPAHEAPDSTFVVSVPVDVGEGVRTLSYVSAWEQFALAAFLQRYWADNQVSCTVTFDPKTEGSQLAHMLDYFQYQLKGISLLPKLELGAYKQMPYEEINAGTYHKMSQSIQPLQFNVILSTETVINIPDKYCEACVTDPEA